MRNMLLALSALLLLLLPIFFSSCVYISGQSLEIGLTPKIHLFEASPSVINAGEVTYLRWQVSNADSISIDNDIGNVASSGTKPVSPKDTTFYILTARNALGEVNAITQIVIRAGQTAQTPAPIATPPVIVTFHADRTSILPGEPITLSWNTTGATDITITPLGQVNSQGAIQIIPAATTTYVLTATNISGKAMAGITVVVVQQYQSAGTVTLHPEPSGSGALVKGSGYLSYTRYESICAGDTNMNLASRAFLSFDLSSIPGNAEIQEAILDLSGYTQHGTPSYVRSLWGNLGALEIYHIEYETLEDFNFTAYNKTGKPVAGATFTSYPLYPWLVNVASSESGEPILQDLIRGGKSRCQFRIQFFTSTNWDGTADALCFDGASLRIKYRTP